MRNLLKITWIQQRIQQRTSILNTRRTLKTQQHRQQPFHLENEQKTWQAHHWGEAREQMFHVIRHKKNKN